MGSVSGSASGCTGSTNSSSLGSIQFDANNISEFRATMGCACRFIQYNLINIRKITWKTVQIGSDTATKIWDGITAISQDKLKRMEHDVIEICFDCNSCNRQQSFFTIDFGRNGSSVRFGAFQKHKRLVEQLSLDNQDVKGNVVKKAFDEQDGRGESYHLIKYNCEHFARSLFDKIKVKIEVQGENFLRYY